MLKSETIIAFLKRVFLIGGISYLFAYAIFWYSEEIIINNVFAQLEKEVLGQEISKIFENTYKRVCSNDRLKICIVTLHETENALSYTIPSLYQLNKVPIFYYFPVKLKKLPLSHMINNVELKIYEAPSFEYFLLLFISGIVLQFPFFVLWFYLSNKRKLAIVNQRLIYEKKVNEVVKQVAHDIQSPLAALEMVIHDMQGIPIDARELIEHAVNRVHEISNNLTSKSSDSSIGPVFPDKVLNSMVKEKEKEYLHLPKLQIENNNVNTNSIILCNEGVLKRVISNLINNSIESQSGIGVISCLLVETPNFLEIIIEDSGPGFPEEILENGIKKGNTIGKIDGKGLGLYYAKKSIEDLGGEVHISNTNSGARVTLSIPSFWNPFWVANNLRLNGDETIVILDDDRSVHNLWLKKIKNMEVICFTSIDLLEKSLNLDKKRKYVFLIDFDLNSPVSGIDFIKRHNLVNSYLVTSKCNEEIVHSFCKNSQTKLIPKHWVASLKIS